ncbi:hypothetical protein [Roseibium suaedae]|uniref:hypothetical protein n=1 Tax=Roseibium suaedae TaxID=735517 RepID=UPI001114EF40|nr:hypothetical protein [Roseibium suaedae]
MNSAPSLPMTVFLALVAMVLAGCRDKEGPSYEPLSQNFKPQHCTPGPLLSELSDRMKIGIAGGSKERASLLYSAYFDALRSCGQTAEAQFQVTVNYDHWPSSWPTPPNSYDYRLLNTKPYGLCITRSGGLEGTHLVTTWYCEKIGWIENPI